MDPVSRKPLIKFTVTVSPSSEEHSVRPGYKNCADGSPCLHGGRCINEGQGVRVTCDCTEQYEGVICEEMPPASNALSTTTIGIIAGAASGAVVIIVLIIVVACCCCRRQQQSQDRELFALEAGVQKRKASHDYTPAPQLKPAIPNLRLSEARKGQNVEFPRNRLTILTKLGSGSFAEVYKAEAMGIVNQNTKSVVAVKMLKATATENDKSDLSKELSLYMYLDPHPNIVNVLGCCTESDPWYLIMEYLPNGNLQGYLRQIRTGESSAPEYKNIRKMTNIPPNDLLTFGVQIARGMEYLASKACIHRDLATRNVLLGDGMVCKVSDFGLARDLEDGQTYEMKSQGRVPVRWMSPESLLHNTYTSQSDVWSFGILLWEVVTLGSHPYPGMSSKQVVKEISVGYRLPKPDHCSQEIYDMMTECWQHDPNDRPTFAKLRNRLENMLADAAGYLEMSDFNDDNYLYLEPDQQSQETAEGEFLSPA
ncbi:tyrosine kinase receptor Cad96Ca-like [Diadema setosum]|uniref:tyrosine kinase receptor Cad96Ca-like n=1 Tax=Diadema setosum TaxID=31175 RepID=UPI003B3B0A17